MNDNKNDDQDRVVCRLNTAVPVSCALMLGVLLSWKGAYANAEESVTVHSGEFANVTIDVDSQSLGVKNLDTSAIVESIGTVSKSIHTDADLSDAAHVYTGKGDQYSQLDVAASQDMRSLDVVDTGSSVEFPAAVGELGGGIDDQKANDMIEQSDQPLVTDTSAKLPVTNIADAQTQVDDAGSQLKEVSSDAASEESTGLPYAVVLALLALIGLVPVARRTDHHHQM